MGRQKSILHPEKGKMQSSFIQHKKYDKLYNTPVTRCKNFCPSNFEGHISWNCSNSRVDTIYYAICILMTCAIQFLIINAVLYIYQAFIERNPSTTIPLKWDLYWLPNSDFQVK